MFRQKSRRCRHHRRLQSQIWVTAGGVGFSDGDFHIMRHCPVIASTSAWRGEATNGDAESFHIIMGCT